MRHDLEQEPEHGAASPAQQIHRAKLDRWFHRTDLLVTALCMGAQHYLAAVDPGEPTGEYETRKIEVMGETSTVRVAVHRPGLCDSDRREIMAAAEVARGELARQLGVPDLARWSVLAPRVMRSRRLLAWLAAHRLINRRPEEPGDPRDAEAQRRSGVTQADRDAAADELAERMAP